MVFTYNRPNYKIRASRLDYDNYQIRRNQLEAVRELRSIRSPIWRNVYRRYKSNIFGVSPTGFNQWYRGRHTNNWGNIWRYL